MLVVFIVSSANFISSKLKTFSFSYGGSNLTVEYKTVALKDRVQFPATALYYQKLFKTIKLFILVMKLSLSKTKKSEILTISKIYMTEFSKPPYSEVWTKKKAYKSIEGYFNTIDLYTIKAENEIVGFIAINPKFMCPGEVAFGEEIAIKEEFQNKGIGTFVFKEIFKIYQKKGFKRFLGIVNINSKAKELYKRIGLNPSKTDILIEKDIRRIKYGNSKRI